MASYYIDEDTEAYHHGTKFSFYKVTSKRDNQDKNQKTIPETMFHSLHSPHVSRNSVTSNQGMWNAYRKHRNGFTAMNYAETCGEFIKRTEKTFKTEEELLRGLETSRILLERHYYVKYLDEYEGRKKESSNEPIEDMRPYVYLKKDFESIQLSKGYLARTITKIGDDMFAIKFEDLDFSDPYKVDGASLMAKDCQLVRLRVLRRRVQVLLHHLPISGKKKQFPDLPIWDLKLPAVDKEDVEAKKNCMWTPLKISSFYTDDGNPEELCALMGMCRVMNKVDAADVIPNYVFNSNSKRIELVEKLGMHNCVKVTTKKDMSDLLLYGETAMVNTLHHFINTKQGITNRAGTVKKSRPSSKQSSPVVASNSSQISVQNNSPAHVSPRKLNLSQTPPPPTSQQGRASLTTDDLMPPASPSSQTNDDLETKKRKYEATCRNLEDSEGMVEKMKPVRDFVECLEMQLRDIKNKNNAKKAIEKEIMDKATVFCNEHQTFFPFLNNTGGLAKSVSEVVTPFFGIEGASERESMLSGCHHLRLKLNRYCAQRKGTIDAHGSEALSDITAYCRMIFGHNEEDVSDTDFKNLAVSKEYRQYLATLEPIGAIHVKKTMQTKRVNSSKKEKRKIVYGKKVSSVVDIHLEAYWLLYCHRDTLYKGKDYTGRGIEIYHNFVKNLKRFHSLIEPEFGDDRQWKNISSKLADGSDKPTLTIGEEITWHDTVGVVQPGEHSISERVGTIRDLLWEYDDVEEAYTPRIMLLKEAIQLTGNYYVGKMNGRHKFVMLKYFYFHDNQKALIPEKTETWDEMQDKVWDTANKRYKEAEIRRNKEKEQKKEREEGMEHKK